MAKAHYVKRARKDNPVVKAGESYYWWKFRFGPKLYSKTPPKPSQLTQSPYLSVIYACQEDWEKVDDPTEINANDWDREGIVSWLGQIRDSMVSVGENLNELVAQYEDAASNMEEYFEGAERIEQLREAGMACEETCERIDDMCTSIEDSAGDIETLELPKDGSDKEKTEEFELAIQDIIDQIDFEEPNFDFHDI